MNNRTDILSLRDALAVLRQTPGQLMETGVEVDPTAELSDVYRRVGAGGTVMRPTTVDGPAGEGGQLLRPSLRRRQIHGGAAMQKDRPHR